MQGLWVNLKMCNIHLMGIPGEERNGLEEIFEATMTGNFPKSMSDTKLQIQEAQRTTTKPNQTKPNETLLNLGNHVYRNYKL